jgi:hypothetical protein
VNCSVPLVLELGLGFSFMLVVALQNLYYNDAVLLLEHMASYYVSVGTAKVVVSVPHGSKFVYSDLI